MTADRRLLPLAGLVAASLLAGCLGSDPLARPETPVPTPEGLVDASDPQPVSEIAWRYGEASWRRDSFGDPLIEAEMGGMPYQIAFYGCERGRDCTDLRFSARVAAPEGEDAEPFEPEAIAAWNRNRRFGKASLDEDGAAVVEMNVTLAGGVTRQNLDAWFDWWRVILSEFREISEI